MAESHRTRYHIGDRVRDRQTGEVGRVIDLNVLADASIVITVAFFTHGVLKKKDSDRIKRGQTGGTKFENLTPEGQTNASEGVTSPEHGGTVSQSAKEKAAQDQRVSRVPSPKADQEIKALHDELEDRYDQLKKRHVAGNPAVRQVTQDRIDAIHARLKAIDHEFGLDLVPVPSQSGPAPGITAQFGGKPAFARKSETTAQIQSNSRNAEELAKSQRTPDFSHRTRVGNTPGEQIGNSFQTGKGGAYLGPAGRVSAHTRQMEQVHDRVDELFNQTQRLEALENRILGEQRGLEGLRGFIADGPRKIDDRWTGFVSELIFDRTQASQSALFKEAQLERILKGIPITPQLTREWSRIIRPGMHTAFDVLRQARIEVGRAGYQGGNRLWRVYGEFFSESLKSGPQYRSLQHRRESIRQALDLARGERRELLRSADYDPMRRLSDQSETMSLPGDTEEEVFVRSHPFQDHVRGEIDHAQVRRDVARYRANSYRGRSGLKQHGLVHVSRLDPKLNPQQYFDQAETGQVVQLYGRERAPFLITRVDGLTTTAARQYEATRNAALQPGPPGGIGPMLPGSQAPLTRGPRRVTLQPVSTPIPILNRTRLHDPFATLDVIKRLPLEQERSAARRMIAHSAAERKLSQLLAETRVVRLRGGLTRHTTAMVDIPIDVLKGFMLGHGPANERELYAQIYGLDAQQVSHDLPRTLSMAQREEVKQTLKQWGMRDLKEFREQADLFGRRFTRRLNLYADTDALRGYGMEAEDLEGITRQLMLTRLHSVEDGTSLAELARRLPNVVRQDLAKVLPRYRRGYDLFEDMEKETGSSAAQRMAEEGAATSTIEDLSESYRMEGAGRYFDPHKYLTADEVIDQAQAYRRRRHQRYSPIEALNAVFGEMRTGNPEAAAVRADRMERVIDWVGANAQRYRTSQDPRFQSRYRARIERLARMMGQEVMEGSPELRELYQKYRQTGSAQAAKEFVQVKEAEAQALLVSGLNRGEITERAAHRLGRPMTFSEEELAKLPGVLNPLIDTASAGNLKTIRALGFEPVMDHRGRVKVLLPTHGEPLEYTPLPPLPGGEERGIARGKATGAARFLGSQEELTVTDQEFAKLFGGQAMQSMGAAEYEQLQTKALDRAIRAQVLEGAAIMNGPTLPILKTGTGRMLGLHGPEEVDRAALARRTAAAYADREKAVVFLDIEANRKTGAVTNVSAQRYHWEGGKLVPADLGVDIATPEQFGARQAAIEQALKEGQTLTEVERTWTNQHGASTLGSVVESEGKLLSQTARYLAENEDAFVAGHNIAGFDIGRLLARAEATGKKSALGVFRDVANDQLVDTMFAEQVLAAPGQAIGLEAVGERRLGETLPQLHVARPDMQLNARVYEHQAAEAAKLAETLAHVGEVRLEANQVLYDRKSRRIYELVGLLDSEAANAAFEKETGRRAEIGFGMALKPLSFVDPSQTGPLRIEYGAAPHTFAREFSGRYELLDRSQAPGRMAEDVPDLARRRARRIIADEHGHGFSNLMADRLRLQLADAAAQGPDALDAAKDELLLRFQDAGSAFERRNVRRAYKYASTYLDPRLTGTGGQDPSRMTAQLQAERRFLNEEMGAHSTIVDWLQETLEAAPASELSATERLVNGVWDQYMRATEALFPWATITGKEVPEGARKISPTIALLGKKVALNVGSEEALAHSVNRLTTNIARHLAANDPAQLHAMLPGSTMDSLDSLALLTQKLEGDRGRILDTEVGEHVRQGIWQQHIAPALEAGAPFQFDGQEGPLFKLGALDQAAALSELLAQGQSAAQQHVQSLQDPLTPRGADREALEELQARFMGGRTPGQVYHDSVRPPGFEVDPRHGMPFETVGESYERLITAAAAEGPENMKQFGYTLRSAARKMTAPEQELLRSLVQRQAPSLESQIFDAIGAIGPQLEEAAGNVAQRPFVPGRLNRLGMDLADYLVEHQEAVGKYGRWAAAFGVGLFVMGATRTPRNAPEAGEPQYAPEGTSSTPGQVDARRQRVLGAAYQTHRVQVQVEGVDPGGLNARELADSIHQALSEYMGHNVAHDPEVDDQRRPMDQRYLSQIAADSF